MSKGYQPSVQRVPTHTHLTSAIAKSENERRKVEDMLAKTTKRALAAEERASEAVVVERKARAALDAREKQMASMRLRVSKRLTATTYNGVLICTRYLTPDYSKPKESQSQPSLASSCE